MKTIRYMLMTVMLAGLTFAFSSCNGEGNEPEGVPVEISALPQSILDFVSDNHPGTQIAEAEVYPNGDYEVMLDDGLELVFDASGNYVGPGD